MSADKDIDKINNIRNFEVDDSILLSFVTSLTNCEIERVGPMEFERISIDSRDIKGKELFIAIKGKNFDGHNFIKNALEQGAFGIISELSLAEVANTLGNIVFGTDFSFIKVPNTILAMHDIARGFRQRIEKVIGITGSVGKTTTKEILKTLLKGYQTVSTFGNFNNEIGLPLSLFRAKKNDKFGIFEMAMRSKGEISQLCSIAMPDIGIITRIAESHIGLLGSMENIARAKGEILDFVDSAFLNFNCKYSRKIFGEMLKDKKGKPKEVIWFGKESDLYIKSHEIFIHGSRLELSGRFGNFVLRAPNIFLPQFEPLLASVAVARFLGLDWNEINDNLQGYHPLQGRFLIKKLGDQIVIDDSYNATCTSFLKGLETIKSLKFGNRRKIFVFGDILEAGDKSRDLHKKVIKKIEELDPFLVYFVGTEFVKSVGRNSKLRFKNLGIDEVKEDLAKILSKEDLVYIKGSNSTKTWKVLELWD
ncbi:UDP-N-acetylmuramoylalanyl-D-glutamyl-2,6-diamin opimelate/D-alanyl-D-alanyl ligase [Thermodesulfobium narugense DSM 14796]|uniref:UDP-N-acetylmuramoyl-tripeptide--D-alanyl-D-alanine ligase n=1 Tax=Thermodesulfobium narugense DSM 14796 TaxID=747365 RepID=M1E5I8_9BACT|nr:UDP-N-acetylmuramoyl-tripeptide--D-alanyl-D-alanine ligase [Thermodesulfobium narugense]AEE14296.1 UDP-N-acetylmuramoylalanyl-D-glutamyl-2,6-diamin opimelate/D-alanyl-D-alanyl ligase [Thermodesulfobium narugense DSM 14796]